MAGSKAVHLTSLLVFSLCVKLSNAGLLANVETLDSRGLEARTPYSKCFDAKSDWRWLRLWSSLDVKVKNTGPTKGRITIVVGANETDVEKQLSQYNGLLPSFLPPWAWFQQGRMSPLRKNCIGVQAADRVHIRVTESLVNWVSLLLTVVGVSLFLAAPRLSKSVVFHYSTGVTVGVLASVLILVYILSRFIPRRTGAFAVLAGGWAFCLYFLHWVLDNFLSMQYKTYLIGYFVLAASISFAVCYWYGPVTGDRPIYLIQLFLQLLGLVCIYNGSQHEGSTVTIVVVLVSIRWLPCGRVTQAASIFRWRSKEQMKIRLLTEDEYYEQGRVETRKALDQLREYCRSPDCNQWKMIANLESPKRFAQFIMGDEDHVTGNELSAYEDDLSLLTLDSSDSGSERISSDSDMETN
ncbi:nuclear envelope integral membrane protein 1-like [Patiria miniata]|uniref:Nuclear envelope integral membrane protein 1 n=1 Tax=Patiria miniata TaxID=46514 RepID=A0A914BR00_PATMI|nr:nuclear envelope integral membrane protein 1-like [Patiria miniata]